MYPYLDIFDRLINIVYDRICVTIYITAQIMLNHILMVVRLVG
ncbi:hypothetical protein FHW36_105334 [Chitinophaga polysaccharea]|uniref:Uncharacterized protein n=1 Tax=Chitinophaga polysaccharea TaxID=1293035 RepID=A0A561PP54_9BACT|nr:hypothetical protein FHW36_105334 [Chitinophaga polysaccharea]